MKIEAGYDISFECDETVPMLLMLAVHPSRQQDVIGNSAPILSPAVGSRDYVDMFGNLCTRLTAPVGRLNVSSRFIIADSGAKDEVAPSARQLAVKQLPDDVLVYLLGSRYCDTQKLSELAWRQFGSVQPGWQRVQAICDYVHGRIRFGYQHARGDRTAAEGNEEGIGV